MLAEHFLRSVSLKESAPVAGGQYPFSIAPIRNLGTLEFHPKVTFLVGDNGMGKSTLLEAIAVAAGLNAEGGSRNFNFASRATHSPLHEHVRVVRGVRRPTDDFFLRAESLYNAASYIDDLEREWPGLLSSYGGDSLHEQSHGESFWALLESRFRGNGLYFLDEPEAALSPNRQLAALARIHQLVRARSQFIIATHSPILMAYPDAHIYLFNPDGIRRVAYQDTEHYQVTRNFLNHVEDSVAELLSDEEVE